MYSGPYTAPLADPIVKNKSQCNKDVLILIVEMNCIMEYLPHLQLLDIAHRDSFSATT